MAQEKSPAFQFYSKDWVSGSTRLMSLEARGAYIDMISFCWHHNGLPVDHDQLAKLIGVSRHRWDGLWTQFKQHWIVRDGKYFNIRQETERLKQATFRTEAQAAGKASAEARRAKFGTAQPKPNPNGRSVGVRASVRKAFERPSERSPNSPIFDLRSPSPEEVLTQVLAEGCAEARARSTPVPVLLEFPTVGTGGNTWDLTESQVAEWTPLFPALDVLAESRKALAWVQANPGRRKTTRGMPAFLVRWLTRAVDGGGGARTPDRAVDMSDQEFHVLVHKYDHLKV